MENPEDLPLALREIKKLIGSVYRLNEKVLDVKSLLEALQTPNANQIYRAKAIKLHSRSNAISSVDVYAEDTIVNISAQKYIFCAGRGNEDATRQLGLTTQVTQRRPLKQIVVKDLPYKLYGHCIGVNTDAPRVTITSHRQGDGKYIWYLGGGIAEAGASMDENQD